jgi:hypothetical protein
MDREDPGARTRLTSRSDEDDRGAVTDQLTFREQPD